LALLVEDIRVAFRMAPACRGATHSPTIAAVLLATVLSRLQCRADEAPLKPWQNGAVPDSVLPSAGGPDFALSTLTGEVIPDSDHKPKYIIDSEYDWDRMQPGALTALADAAPGKRHDFIKREDWR
jgi:hypothetical protein